MHRNLNLQSHRWSGREGERGQILILFAVFLTVLVLFMGLGIDLGFAYITKAQLSKAVDAAALAGMSNF
jgi:Flp pilus assembly protein TadG